MSWSNFTYDAYTPSLTGRVTSGALPIITSPATSIGNCEGSCVKESGNRCPAPVCDCVPAFPNMCPTGSGLVYTSNLAITQSGTTSDGCQECCVVSPGDPDPVCFAPKRATCTQTQEQTCGTLQPSVCTLGSQGIGICAENCTYGTDWDVISPATGWVDCSYMYNFQNFFNGSYGPFANWLKDIWTGGTNGIAPNGIAPSVRNRIRDTNFIYACLTDFYNSIYNTGYYASHQGTNNFSNVDYIRQGFQSFAQNMVSNIQNMIFLTSSAPTALINAIQSALVGPVCSQQESTFQITFQLSYSQHIACQQSGNVEGYLESCLNNLLQDSQGSMTRSGISLPVATPTLTNAFLQTYSAIQFQDSNGNPFYSYTSGISPQGFGNSNSIFATAQYIATVNSWSPMLVIYFANTFQNVSFDSGTCTAIGQQINTIPVKCNQVCQGSTCIDNIKDFCGVNYTPPSFISATAAKLLYSILSEDCICYSSLLAPAGQGYNDGNPASMCFDQNCSPTFRSIFGLNDSLCRGYCVEVDEWVQGNSMRDSDYLDRKRFEQICGEVPLTTPVQYNSSVMVTGIVTTILGGLLTFSICKHRNYSSGKTLLITFLITLIIACATAFFTRDLAGCGFCNTDQKPYKFECQSRITKVKLPNQFCNFQETCECLGDADCPNGCTCAGSLCIPPSGQRNYITVNKTRPNIVMIVLTVIISVCFPAALIYLYEDYHWPIPKSLFIGGVLLLGALGLGYMVYSATKKYPEKVLQGSCSATGPVNGCLGGCPTGYTCDNSGNCVCSTPCGGKKCGTGGCGISCGTCPAGYVCNNGECVGPTSFNIQYTDSQGTAYYMAVQVTDVGISPRSLALYNSQMVSANPSGFKTMWTYNPSVGTISIGPDSTTGQQVYALTTGAPPDNICDPYPVVGTAAPGPVLGGDYQMYVDPYVPGAPRFERWVIHTDGVICDSKCNNRCIAAFQYRGTNGVLISQTLQLTTTSPWNLSCGNFIFNPAPPPGTFSETPGCGSVQVCPDRTGNNPGCPPISVTTSVATGVFLDQTCALEDVIKTPHPQWGNIVNEMGPSVCGVAPGNPTFQQGCCGYLGDSCYSSGQCSQIAQPFQ